MKILVTGATGFLGKHLCNALKAQNHSITEISTRNCDLQKPDSLQAYNSFRFDQIYHLAAWTQAGDFCLKHPAEQWMINQKINTHVLDWWATRQPQAKMIAMGTSCSYDPQYPLQEEEYLKGEPIPSLFTYAMTKRMLLTGLIAFQKQFDLEYLYLIPSTLYGPGYHEDGRQMHFIFDLIRKILRGVVYDEPVILWGNGEQERELIHVEDFIAAMLSLKEVKNTWINIGGGKGFSIKEFAAIISNIVGYDQKKIQYDTSKYVGAKSKILDICKIQRYLPSYSVRPLHLGLEKVVEWFKKHESVFTI